MVLANARLCCMAANMQRVTWERRDRVPLTGDPRFPPGSFYCSPSLALLGEWPGPLQYYQSYIPHNEEAGSDDVVINITIHHC